MKTNTKLTKLILIILLIPFVLVSCGYYRKPKCARWNRCYSCFVDNMKCEAPCWQGITPGLTTRAEANEILENLDFIESIYYTEESRRPFDGRFNIFDKQDAWMGSLYLLDDKVVYMSFSGELSATFGEAEEQIAPAQKVLLFSHYLKGITIKVYNFDQGVAYGTANFYGAAIKHRFSPKTSINTLQFFDPDIETELIEKNFFTIREFQSGNFMDNLQDWQGYGELLDLYELVEVSFY